ncbi:LacI family DNA-binding transcriptional regulator [Pseudovibrio sp. Tun.PSC04-5.I4]|uniref:LacI family DNA-binding transcriptional regulator n=1 Tax=Pseudovibrio sp. Tun.PSC04-5.I4 TaxID=1798213 RepID=UPI000887FE76|nr:LacI family DNA-binding transcriptional regulator [Pseudovibrio sp. Tun.PSC04-5.I4]SDR01366.1 transcriptional regulator, LacI family [Pseudovibrio sp. Tun.PSC04-5.I4]
MTKPATLKDIAECLGISTATVSRGLAGDKRVTFQTQERVKQAAKKLNYRANAIARSLRTKKTGVVLLVVKDIKNPFYLDVMVGVETAARSAGYSVMMCNCENDSSLVTCYFEMLKDGRADGMLLMTGRIPEDVVNDPLFAKMPVVVALEAVEGHTLPHVLVDNVQAAKDAVGHLIKLGHTRIAHVGGPRQEWMSDRRLEGYRGAMVKAGLPIFPGYEERGTFELHSAQEPCRRLMKLKNPPTAIFFANDEMAVGSFQVFKELGYRIPQDISLIGFDNLFWCEVSDPPLTTISQPRTKVGQEAFQLLLSTMSGEKPQAEPIVLPTELYLRKSTAVPADKKQSGEN